MEPQDARNLAGGAIDELMLAAHNEWSGELFFSAGGQDQGMVSFDHGRIAWAISAEQQDDLATFLWRLGRISREQVTEVRRQYERHKGARKLGRLLEETGLIKAPVLRRCLLLHARMAITSFLALGELASRWNERSLSADQEMTFAVREVLPELLTPEQDLAGDRWNDQPWWTWHRRNRLLEGLDQVVGYLGSAVFSSEGELLAADGRRELFEPVELGQALSSALVAAGQGVGSTVFGPVEVLFVDFQQGSVVARWIEEGPRRHLLLLALDRDGRLDASKYILQAAAPSIVRAIERWALVGGEPS